MSGVKKVMVILGIALLFVFTTVTLGSVGRDVYWFLQERCQQ